MRKKLLVSILMVPIITSTAFLTSFGVAAQVKIGSNPTISSGNANLEVRATNASPFIIQKNNGYLGLNTLTPGTPTLVSASSASQGLQVDLKYGTSSIYVCSDGGVTNSTLQNCP